MGKMCWQLSKPRHMIRKTSLIGMLIIFIVENHLSAACGDRIGERTSEADMQQERNMKWNRNWQ